MHSGLNRVIKGSTSQPTNNGALSQGINHTAAQLFPSSKWPSFESQPPNHASRDINHSAWEPNRPKDDQRIVCVPQTMNMQNTDKNPALNITRRQGNECQLQRMSKQQEANGPGGKHVPFDKLLRAILPQIDKDRGVQLQGLYDRLRRNNIDKNEFLPQVIALVGEHMFKEEVRKLQHGQVSVSQGLSSSSPGQYEHTRRVSGTSKDNTFEMSSRLGFSTPMYKPEPKSFTVRLEPQNASVGNLSLAAGSNANAPRRKPTIALQEPTVSLSKKQKVCGAFSDQSIEQQLNDVTAVSGVNLQEEEELLFYYSGSKVGRRVSEASRKVVQEEEEMLLLQRIPLQKKVAEIMAKCGVKNKSNDVDRCLSLCVEERMHGLITNLIRLSKQRLNIEKQRHQTVITSDIWQQIMSLNQNAMKDWDGKQADTDNIQRAVEVNKDEADKLRTTAANVAARAAAGGDDMLSKWKLMAEQAHQKREDRADITSVPKPNADLGTKPVSTSKRNNTTDNPNTKDGPARKSLPNQNSGQTGGTISVRDVICVLGKEIQMSGSTMMYRLYEQVDSHSVS